MLTTQKQINDSVTVILLLKRSNHLFFRYWINISIIHLIR